MANEDILLTIGVSLESLKKAQRNVENMIKQWEIPEVGLIDEKSLKAAGKAAEKVLKETQSASKKVQPPKIDTTKNVTAIKRVSEAVQAQSTSSFLAKEEMKKLADTTAYYTERAKLQGVTLANVDAELKSYQKTETKGIQLDTTAIARKDKLTSLYKQLSQSQQIQKLDVPKAEEYNKANVQLQNLAKTTDYFQSKSKIMGANLSDVKSELNAYLKVEAEGINLDGVALRRKEELTTQYAKLEKAQKGFFHGIDIPRLMLWAVGWKIMYGALNIVLGAVANVGKSFTVVNEMLDTVRVANQETARSYDQLYSKASKSIFATAANSRIAVEDIAKAFKTLTYEGAKVETSLTALAHVRDLMVLTGEKELPVATAIIETYTLFKDKIQGATTESEKLAKVTDLLAAMFTKAHISMAEYQQIMAMIAPMGSEMVKSYDFLVRLLIFADSQMLQGRKSGMALMATLAGLTENAGKLSEVFGIIFKPGEMVTIEHVLMKIKAATKGLNDEARKSLLSKIFKGSELILVLKLLRESDIELKNYTANIKNLASESSKAADRSRWMAISLKNAWEGTANVIKTIVDLTNTLTFPVAKFLGAIPKEKPKTQYERINPKTGKFEKSDAFEIPEKDKPFDQAGFNARLELARIEVRKSKSEIAYTQNIKEQLKMLDMKQKLALDEAAGASFTYLQQEKLNIAYEEAVGFIADEKDKQEIINNLIGLKEVTAKNIFETFNKTVDVSKYEQEILASTNSILTERYALQIKIAEETKALADDLQSKTTDFVKNMMSGTANVKDFMKGISESFQSAFAENIVQMFGEKTGIFANLASGFMSPLQKAHYNGVKSAVPLIMKAHIDGITQGNVQSNIGKGGSTGTSDNRFIGNILSFFNAKGSTSSGGGYNTGQTMTYGGKSYPVTTNQPVSGGIGSSGGMLSGVIKNAGIIGMIWGILQSGGGENALDLKTKKNEKQAANIITYNGNSFIGMGNFSYRSLIKDQSTAKGAQATWNIFDPSGAVGITAAGMKKQYGHQSVTTPGTVEDLKVASKIDLTNKELQIVNRNLEGIKRGFEGYIFQRSAYFSADRAAETFSADKNRGYIG